jgi:hypothetical protein
MLSPSPFLTQTSLPTATSTLRQTIVVSGTIFGVGMDSYKSNSGFEQISQTGIDWVRTDALVSWAAVESVEGTYDWNVLATLAQGWQTASSRGIEPIVNVRVTPDWAQLYPGHSCGPMKQEYFDEFGTFIHDLVARYSVAPYNVKYWEIWNEEDIDRNLVDPNSWWGCWGDPKDTYYGGGYYAEMLKAVYPQIKAADPQAKVLIGGLLMDCDPRPGGGCAIVGHNPKPAMFLEGILRNNGGSYFDGVSFHAYDYYQGHLGQYSNANWQTAWNTTGPVGLAKAQFIMSLLSKYGISGKFLMNTESALICGECSNDSTFETTKAYYVAQAYGAAIAQRLHANLWFSLLGWNNSGLLNSDLSPLPAYTAFEFGRNELRDAAYVRKITPFAGVKGYEYNRGDRYIWVLWSLDGNTHSINLCDVPVAAWDALGNPVSRSAYMNVSLNPLYLEWNPWITLRFSFCTPK